MKKIDNIYYFFDRKYHRNNDPRSLEYNKIAAWELSEVEIHENNYPTNNVYKQHGFKAIILKKLLLFDFLSEDESKRKCKRCYKSFDLNEYNEKCVNQCVYHRQKYPDRVTNKYSCCGQYEYFRCVKSYHETDQIYYKELSDFISLPVCSDNRVLTLDDVYGLKCKTSYTIAGRELTRATVVGYSGNVVYDAIVEPVNRIIGYKGGYVPEISKK